MRVRRKLNMTTQYVLVIGALLLAANILLGLVLINQSRASLRAMLEKNMLDVTNIAAGLMDGDALGALTEDDVDGPYFNEVIRTLSVFQERVEIEFIYAVRQVGPETFTFTVDPDPEEPAAFGEEIVFTPALARAGQGVASVDSDPQADRWGNFYSAYSPVFDSSGAVAGIIGVDFDAEWYQNQITRASISVTVISILTTLIGAAVIILITSRTRTRFRALSDELGVLSADVDELTGIFTSNPYYSEGAREPDAGGAEAPHAGDAPPDDEIGALSEKIRGMESDMQHYLAYAHALANTDALTGVGNTTAYQERIRALSALPDGESGGFTVFVFDIDLLKEVNDLHGHAFGDMIIRGAAAVIARIFGKENVYRIGGDEFLAVGAAMPHEQALELLHLVEADAASFSPPDPRCAGLLALSGGVAEFRPGEDTGFQEVFVRADEAMYKRKSDHHARAGVVGR